MTISETKLLDYIRSRGGIESLFQASLDLDLHYSTAHYCVKNLESRGLVNVIKRRAGSRLVITPADLRRETTETRLLATIRKLGRSSYQELAVATGIDYHRIYRMCKSFERAGLVKLVRQACFPCTVMIVASA